MAALLTGSAFAQSVPAGRNHTVPLINPALLKPVKIPANGFTGDVKMKGNGIVPKAKTSHIVSGQPTTARDITETTIGTTYYDLQTNGSVNDRISNNGDGTISAVWTFSPDWTNGFPNRGTGYNYFDGTSWESQPTTRIEGNNRSGFTNIGVTSSGAEVVVGHSSTTAQLLEARRLPKGMGEWITNTTALESPATSGDLWAKTAVWGENFHVISLTTPVISGGTTYNGLDGALLYDRSTDGGVTWDATNVLLPDEDTAHYDGFNGDSYQIDARGNTVAIVTGDISYDVILWKSMDNGSTWTKTIILQHPFPFFTDDTITDINGDGNADSIEVCDGSLSVLIDDQNMVHVWWGDAFILNDVAGDALYSYYPGINSIMYWNESFGENAPAAITGALDLNGNDTLDLPIDDLSGQLLIGQFGFSSLATMPNAGIDSNGNIYLAYSAAVENSTDLVGKAIRHTYVIVTKDHGQTWGDSVIDVVDDITQEGVYASIARYVDDKVHIVYQKDFCAGISGLFIATNDPDPCNDNELNSIAYVEFPVSDLGVSVGIPSIKANNEDIHVFPNPSTGVFTIAINGSVVNQMDIKVSNVLGQTVRELNNQNLTNSKVTVDLNTLPSGNYLLSARAGTKSYNTIIRISGN
ncbi:MAG: T9SS type A sorting domain-containing protein [Chitinophagales bacterium]|nr:T9SS type A sorting domain-containing protein [Chitinophagales bacterium]